MTTLSSILPPISLASASGTLPVGNGGTGAVTLTANAVLIGNGTSAVTAVAPGTTGNLLQSNGTTWISGPAPPVPVDDALLFAWFLS